MGRFLALVVLFLGLASSAFGDYPVKPIPSETPGQLCSNQDRHFSGYRYRENIPYCRRDVERSLKSQIYAKYGIPSHCRNQFTVDHFYPLSMGGNNNRKNLWPEHREIKALREDLELVTFERLRDGELTQQEALQIIEEAKMNPPIEELNKVLMRGDGCGRSILNTYSNF